MNRMQIILAALAISTGPALAGTWEKGFERGLDNLSASADGGRVVVVCDPDRVRNPETGVSAAYVYVTMPKERAAEEVVFLAENGHQARFALRYGDTALHRDHPDAWPVMLDMLKAGGRIAIVSSRDSFTLNVDPVADLDCS